MKQKFSLGSQEFSEVINNNCIYVDKTENIYKLLLGGKYYFISRPRRFGKSLLANTIKEIFSGNKELFKGLWIYDKWDWNKKYPVVKMSFSSISHNTFGLEKAINIMLDDTAKKYNIKFSQKNYSYKFQELIEKLAEKQQVVIIIDEYDKPIIDYMDNISQAEENREILKNFYSILKDADKYIKFLFITGVSKFSKIYIFSDLNNLNDITIDKNFSEIVGWTKNEIEQFFPDYIKELAEEYKDIHADIMPEIKKWYNGYSWDGKTTVHNPVSIMNLFSKQFFANYWFATGTPTMLMDIIRTKKITAFDIENTNISSHVLDKYDFKRLHFNSLLFQTGYLTIKKIDLRTGRITLDYPNKEVAEAFSKHIVAELTSGELEKTDSLLFKIADSFTNNTIDKFIKYTNIILKNIPYTIVEDKEKYYHSLFYLIMKLTGYQIETEIMTIDGRIDAVVLTDKNIFIIEFKINQSAKKAIQQIKDKKYAEKYDNSKKQTYLLGINFDTNKKRIDDFCLETK